MSQWQVIDIMTFNPYSLQYYSFWKGKIGFGFLKHEDRDCFLDNANVNRKRYSWQLTVSLNHILHFKRYSYSIAVYESKRQGARIFIAT